MFSGQKLSKEIDTLSRKLGCKPVLEETIKKLEGKGELSKEKLWDLVADEQADQLNEKGVRKVFDAFSSSGHSITKKDIAEAYRESFGEINEELLNLIFEHAADGGNEISPHQFLDLLQPRRQ